MHVAPGAAYLIAIAWAALVGQWLIGPIMDRAWRVMGSDVPDRSGRFAVRLVGMTEAVVYVAAVGLAAPLLASAWLVLKGLVVAWPREAIGGDDRDRFNLFLAGNGLSLAFGIGAGLAAAEMAGAGDTSVIALGLFGPVLLAVAADLYIRWMGRDGVDG